MRHVISRLPLVLSLEWTKAGESMGERGRILASVGGHLREWNLTNNPIIRISTVGCGCSGTSTGGGGGAFAEDGDCFAGYHPCPLRKYVPGVLVLEYRTTRLQVTSTRGNVLVGGQG